MTRLGGTSVATLLLCGALAFGSVAASAQAGAGAPDSAVAAKKKKKKKKKSCNSKKQSRAYNALSCTALVRVITNNAPAPNGTERYDFCRRSYRYAKTDYGLNGDGVVISYTTTYNGNWRVLSSQGTSGGLTGAIQYSVANFSSVTSTGQPAEQPLPAILSQSISFGPFGVNFAGQTFLYNRARC